MTKYFSTIEYTNQFSQVTKCSTFQVLKKLNVKTHAYDVLINLGIFLLIFLRKKKITLGANDK